MTPAGNYIVMGITTATTVGELLFLIIANDNIPFRQFSATHAAHIFLPPSFRAACAAVISNTTLAVVTGVGVYLQPVHLDTGWHWIVTAAGRRVSINVCRLSPRPRPSRRRRAGSEAGRQPMRVRVYILRSKQTYRPSVLLSVARRPRDVYPRPIDTRTMHAPVH